MVEGTLHAYKCVFIGNSAYGGGAIYGDNTGRALNSIAIIESEFEANYAKGSVSGYSGHGYWTARDVAAHMPIELYIYDSTFDPFHDRSSQFPPSVYFSYVQTGCEEYPCDPGFACSYRQFSLLCEPCTGSTVGSDGLRCSPCLAGQGANSNRTGCVPCDSGNYSISGVCQSCDRPQVVSADQTSCSLCPAGRGPDANFSSV